VISIFYNLKINWQILKSTFFCIPS